MKRIAITGGPCGGKDSVLDGIVQRWVKKWGLIPHTLPEIATLVINAGFSPPDLMKRNRAHYIAMQRLMITAQGYLSGEIERLAKETEDVNSLVIFENRGIIDARSYLNPREFITIISKDMDMSEIGCRDGIYDAVFHFRTVADTKPNLYMKLHLKNPARYENTPHKAIAADERTLSSWLGHPHLRVIPNITLDGRNLDFKEKIALFKKELKHALGVDGSYEIEKKFLLHRPCYLRQFPVPYNKIEVVQTYLHSDIGGGRVRRRTQDGHSLYYLTKKSHTKDPGVMKEQECKISEGEYLQYLKHADPNFRTIIKVRVYFVWKNQYFELDYFKEPDNIDGLILLELELFHKNQKWEIPEWLGEYRDVTGVHSFSNRELARIK